MNNFSLCLLALLSAAAAHAGTLYGVTVGNPAALYTIDQSTGASTPVVTLSGAAPQTNWSGLEYYNGLFYGTGFDTPGAVPQQLTNFVSIDPVTGATTVIATTPNAILDRYYYALAVNAATGIFYSYNDNGNQLYSITAGGVFTPIGAPGSVDWFDGFAFDPTNGLLYGVTNAGTGPYDLWTIDPATGTQTSVGSLGLTPGAYSGLAIDPDTGILYFSTGDEGTGFYTINKATGAATSFGVDFDRVFTGLAFGPAPVPEPATLALTGGAFGALLWLRRRSVKLKE